MHVKVINLKPVDQKFSAKDKHVLTNCRSETFDQKGFQVIGWGAE